jgi:GLPGLI family protein
MDFSRSLSALLLFFVALHGQARAQNAIFLSEGKIEFEKKINLYARMDEDNSWTELEKKTMPKFKTTYFDLLFTRNKSLYRPGRDNTDNNKLWEQPAEENVVYSDLDKASSVSQKKVFEQLFLVQDSIRRIKWKITDENRVIAGFNCRRANAIIMDSIYVVAFYTDEILTPGGPESFTGLPGMILGVSLPHQHLTWFATKVQAVKVADTEIALPQKGKKVTNPALKQTLQASLKQWGKEGRNYIQAALL